MDHIDPVVILSGLLVLVILVAVGGMMWNRIATKRGISWKIIRFNAICIALPLAGVLALNGKLDQAATAIIAGALGYAFGKSDPENDEP
jgi:hypothetical protein